MYMYIITDYKPHLYLFIFHYSTGQMEMFMKGLDAINDDLPGEDPEVVAEAIDGEAGPLNGQ